MMKPEGAPLSRRPPRGFRAQLPAIAGSGVSRPPLDYPGIGATNEVTIANSISQSFAEKV